MTYACTSREPFQPAAPNALIKRRVREVRGATSGDELSPVSAEEEREEDCEMHKDKRPQSGQQRRS